MSIRLFILLWFIRITGGRHFNGGTINWAPINPYDNSSSVGITITQSYSWAYPTITCAANVPISTSGRSGENSNLACVVDCSTDGNYSTKPIDILTDCTSVSTSLGMMTSSRSRNLTLTAGAHFYLANVGNAWVALNDPAQKGLEWSIVTFIDLRMRPDGFINTPPVAKVISPQYAIVNRTVQINIPVSDVNAGDDVRCRWSTYTTGYRRRKRSDEEHKTDTKFGEFIYVRRKRACNFACWYGCSCSDSGCSGTNCGTGTCGTGTCTATAASTTATTASTTTIATTQTTTATVSTTSIATTTIETQGTLKSTSSYPYRQAIDECGGICYPGSVPSGTSMSNCTISFTGLKAGVWYAIAVQVEDFINETSTIPLSSVPVQLLIYVKPIPTCSNAPLILPLNRCLEVQVGISIIFDLYAMNLCNPSVANVTDMIISTGIPGMTNGNLISSSTNSSLSYLHFTWTPQANQIGSKPLCIIAYTSDQVQSDQYCVVFTVKTTSDLCVTTTATSTTTTSVTTTSTTSATTTTTSQTTTTTTSTTTSVTTTTTTATTTTSTTSTSTTSSTSSTSSSSTSTTSTSTSTTSTSTSTTSTSVTTTTSTRTTATTATTTTTTTTLTTTTKAPGSSINWPLIVGLSLLALLLSLCCCCYCLYRLCWSPAARRRRRRQKTEDVCVEEHISVPQNIINKTRKTRGVDRLFRADTSNKNYQFYDVLDGTDSTSNTLSSARRINSSDIRISEVIDVCTDNKEMRPTSTVSVKRIRRTEIKNVTDKEKSIEKKDVQVKSSNDQENNRTTSSIPHSAVASVRVDKISRQDLIDEDQMKKSDHTHEEPSDAERLPRSKTTRVNVTKLPRSKTAAVQQDASSNIAQKNTVNSEISPLEMQPIVSCSKTAARVTNPKRKANIGVIVTKLPRTLTSARPD